jgi:hypothetical protein
LRHPWRKKQQLKDINIKQSSKYINKFNEKYHGHKKAKIGELIEPGKRGEIIKNGTLVLMPFSNGAIQLKILEEDIIDKGFSIPLRINSTGTIKGITSNYLLWFLQQGFVVEHLLFYVTGSVMPRIKKEDLFNITIALPQKNKKYDNISNREIIKIDTDPFRKLINAFYQDYRQNYKKGRFQTAMILAGSITESILYQLLLENGVDRKILEDDNSLSLGKMIQYIKLLKLDKELELPMSALIDLQKRRNRAVHVNLALKNNDKYSVNDLKCFDDIIMYFGI